MNIKLSALALGITLAYGATAAMAADVATIHQSGSFNEGMIEQFDNNGAIAAIITHGFDNDASIKQEQVTNANATIYQHANAGTASIDQGGSWSSGHYVSSPWPWHGPRWVEGTWSDGSNQTAVINQTGGWGNDAWVTQTGQNVAAYINQSGFHNDAGIAQAGNGSMNVASIGQVGANNDGYIEQQGSNLVAAVLQTGMGHEAVITQVGSNKVASIVQYGGYQNNAYINQR